MIPALHPLDIAVALRLADQPSADYRALAADLALSPSTVHAAVRRLRLAGLVRVTDGGAGAVNRHALLEFLEHGVRYAFPAVIGGATRGVPTAHAGPALGDAILPDDPLVWPDPDGDVEGRAISPLLPRAHALAHRAPRVYALLTAVDALRVGRARERQLASRYLRHQLGVTPTADGP